MLRNRKVLRLTFVAIFTLTFAANGWCGGLFGLSTSGKSFCAGESCADEAGYLTVSAGRGPSYVQGSSGRNPGVSLSDLSLGPGYTNAAQLKLHDAEIGRLRFNFAWDHYYSFCSGSAYYFGPPHPILAQGDTIDSQFQTLFDVLSLDVNAISMLGGPGSMKAGPRLQFNSYSETLWTSDAEAGRDVGGSKGFNMFGLGAWASCDLASMTRLGWSNPFVDFSPRLDVAAAYGWGSGMRYWEWEAFLQVLKFKHGVDTGKWVTIGPLGLELGYARYTVIETSQQAGLPVGSEEGNSRLAAGMALIRGTIDLSF